jgi:eukaryotic-like serine/threonine-protein kinase
MSDDKDLGMNCPISRRDFLNGFALSIVVADPIVRWLTCRLGRAYAILGDRTKARSAYQDFLALWKDADTNIPVLKQARSEYVKLQ